MRIVLKTRDMSGPLIEEVAERAKESGIREYSGIDNSTTGTEFVIISPPCGQRLLVHFDSVEGWSGAINACQDFLTEYHDFCQFLSSRAETYFDIGVDNSEINERFYHEFILPTQLNKLLVETEIVFCITLYQDTET